MTIASRIIVIVTLLVIAGIGFMPPRQSLDYSKLYPQADGTLAPRPIPVARVGLFSQQIYASNYHKGGAAYTDIAANVDAGRLVGEVILAVALGGIAWTIAYRPRRGFTGER